jgi:hypothetical protein
LYAKSDRTDITRVELIDLLRSLSKDWGERFIHKEQTEYEIQSNE